MIQSIKLAIVVPGLRVSKAATRYGEILSIQRQCSEGGILRRNRHGGDDGKKRAQEPGGCCRELHCGVPAKVSSSCQVPNAGRPALTVRGPCSAISRVRKISRVLLD